MMDPSGSGTPLCILAYSTGTCSSTVLTTRKRVVTEGKYAIVLLGPSIVSILSARIGFSGALPPFHFKICKLMFNYCNNTHIIIYALFIQQGRVKLWIFTSSLVWVLFLADKSSKDLLTLICPTLK